MFRKAAHYALATLTVLGLQTGCSSSRELTRTQQPTSAPASAPSVLTKDGTLYRLQHYRVADSQLLAAGTSEKDGRTELFKGHLALSDIDYAQAQGDWGSGKKLLAAGVAVVFSALAIDYLNHGSSGLSIRELRGTYYPPSYGGGGSCPFIYSYDGGRYHLESESFAGAVFKGAERASYDNLEWLRPVDGQYRLKLANESDETEYVDHIKLLVVDAPPGVAVLPNANGDFHTIAQPVHPVRCVDRDDRDVLSTVREKDDRWWESDLRAKDLTSDDGLRDGLVLEFPRPPRASIAKLVVRGINTTLGVFAFEQLFKLKGDGTLRWYQRLEREPAERRKLISWMKREGMLHVQVWQNGEWVEQTALLDVGPRVSKDQVAVLDLSQVTCDVVKIKLESATDLWRIDCVYLDYSQDLPVEIAEVDPGSAVDERGEDVSDLLRRDDDRYYVTMKGQYARLTFDEVPARAGLSRHYAVSAKGYYHPWLDSQGKDQTALLDRVLTEPLFGSRAFMPAWKALKGQ
jgi:hypothetical protein